MSTLQPAPAGLQLPGAPEIDGLTFRLATDADWDVIATLLTRARAADGVDEVRTGADLRAEYEPLDAFSIGRDVLAAELDGSVVGLAVGTLAHREGALNAETWGTVDPAHRNRGIGTAMWRWTVDRLTGEAEADPRPGPRGLRSFAVESEASDIALLTDQGYVPIRHGFEMRRPLTGQLPAHPVPDGLEMRPVTDAQHRAIFAADNEAFEDHWGHRVQTDGDFVARFSGPDVDTGLWQVAWDGDEVAGVVMNAIFAVENEALGVQRAWLEHVSVRRPWRGRGVAKALVAASFEALQARGITEAWLGVDASNPTGALRLYEGLGFTVARRWHAYGRPLDRPAPAGWTPEGESHS
ncbi:MAG: GNAT family N-acetyltransferase [Candidatus Limnocylindrales bacterium]